MVFVTTVTPSLKSLLQTRKKTPEIFVMLKQTVYKKACDCNDFRFRGQCFENYITRNLSIGRNI